MDGLSGLLCIVVPIALIVLIVVGSRNAAAARAKALAEAREAYQAALAALKAAPTEATLRQAALDAGRRYSALTRENKGVTVFDEVALKNDLDAASAGAVAVQAAPVAAPTDAAARLRRLDELRAEGLLSEAEHAEQRLRILGSM
jgi:hypothetical protein